MSLLSLCFGYPSFHLCEGFRISSFSFARFFSDALGSSVGNNNKTCFLLVYLEQKPWFLLVYFLLSSYSTQGKQGQAKKLWFLLGKSSGSLSLMGSFVPRKNHAKNVV